MGTSEMKNNSCSIHNDLKDFTIPLPSIFLLRYKSMQRPLPLIEGIQTNTIVSS